MNREAIDQKVKQLIEEQLGVTPLDENDLFRDLGADSLDVVELVMAIEEEFFAGDPQFDCGIEQILDQDRGEVHVKDIVDFIEKKLAPKEATPPA